MVDVGDTETLFPVPTAVPPHEPVYHLNVVPDPPEYVKVVLEPLQIVVLVALTELGTTGNGFTVILAV